MTRRVAVFSTLVLAVVVAVAVALDWWISFPENTTARYVGRDQCARCHEAELEAWTGSDHDLAMDVATPETVLGNFDDQLFTHFGQTSTMFRRDDRFYMRTDNGDGKLEDFPIKYTFGVRPLQQYLVEFSDGRVQCLPVAWDTEGKRWFHLYPNEPIPYDDPLHWTGPLQNWNYMCADCHSTNLQRNYDVETNRYHTTFSEIDVSCEACHGPGSTHVELADSWGLFWDRRHGYGLPKLKDPNPRVEIESCAPCHSRRRIVAADYRPGDKFLDYYLPEMIDGQLYYADGQILEEDYVYGSFIQSRMYREEVRCTDCHDPHTAKVKFQDNRLCGQCHVPAKYDTPLHHHHPDESQPGTRCVECHMPETTYMVVDPRRDHSIFIPRPQLTVDLGIPNACNGCHNDESKGETPEWAVETVEKWYGKPKGPKHFAYAIAAGRAGRPEARSSLLSVAKRRDTSAMVRASAIALLGQYDPVEGNSEAFAGLRDSEGLVRHAAVHSLQHLEPSVRIQRIAPLLNDPLRAVRTEAARVLSDLPPRQLAPERREAFERALAEYLEGQEAVGDQAAARLNMAVVYSNLGQPEKAEQEYEIALRIDPQFVPAMINLAMLYDRQNMKDEAEALFERVIEIEPELADAHYSLGLLIAEIPGRLEEAAQHLRKAAEYSPDNARIRYNYGLALQNLGRPNEAEQQLREAHRLAPQRADHLYALAVLYAQQEHWDRAMACVEEMLRRWPNDERARQLMAHLRSRQRAAGADEHDPEGGDAH